MSTYITATDKPVYWATYSGGAVLWSGLAEAGGHVGTPLAVDYNADPNAFLLTTLGKGANGANPLPAVGAQVEAGQIYSYGADSVICRQTHTRIGFAPLDTPALFIVYRANAAAVLDWIPLESVLVGMHRLYNTVEYVCLQAHVTQSDWTPPAVPALWAVYVVAGPVWAAGVAYKVGDQVTYLGHTYKCLQAHTSIATWNPAAVPALWQLVS
jgi:hypothetical protein